MNIKLVDYKGKFTIGCDEYSNDPFEYPAGEVSREQFIEELSWRVPDADYYGVPVYYGKDKELIKLIEDVQRILPQYTEEDWED